MTINRKCPFCDQNEFGIERVGQQNLFLLKCLNPNVVSSFYVEYKPWGRFRRVSVTYPKPRNKMSSYAKQQFEKLQTPFWKLMGQKAKPKDIAYEKYLKARGMTYGDAVLERNLHADNPSAYSQFMKGGSSDTPKYKKSN